MAFCPYCFEKINLNKLNLRCASKSCCEPGSTERHIIPRKLAHVDRNGYGICDVCKKTTRTLVCSFCNHDLPDTIRDSETKIISIVGAKGSGKSYYVATLLRQIMEEGLLAHVNDSSVRFIDDGRKIYNDRYKNFMDKRIPLEGTNLVTDIIKDNPPVLVQLTKIIKKRKIDNTYSFFDAAGESFKDATVLSAITPYIAHSEAIIILLDPRQVPKLNSEIMSAIPNLPPVTDDTYEEIINSVADVVKNAFKLPSNKKIQIPLCVAFSKWDLLIKTPNLLPPDLLISRPDVYAAKGFNVDLVENASAELRALLSEWDRNFVNTAESKFSTVRYFGFSAWGMGSNDGKDIPAIASFRVEDPFLWILNNNGSM